VKPFFKLLKTWREDYTSHPEGKTKGPLQIRYQAKFWKGEYVIEIVEDVAINGRWQKTSSNVSYFSQMPKAPNDCGY